MEPLPFTQEERENRNDVCTDCGESADRSYQIITARRKASPESSGKAL